MLMDPKASRISTPRVAIVLRELTCTVYPHITSCFVCACASACVYSVYTDVCLYANVHSQTSHMHKKFLYAEPPALSEPAKLFLQALLGSSSGDNTSAAFRVHGIQALRIRRQPFRKPLLEAPAKPFSEAAVGASSSEQTSAFLLLSAMPLKTPHTRPWRTCRASRPCASGS